MLERSVNNFKEIIGPYETVPELINLLAAKAS